MGSHGLQSVLIRHIRDICVLLIEKLYSVKIRHIRVIRVAIIEK